MQPNRIFCEIMQFCRSYKGSTEKVVTADKCYRRRKRKRNHIFSQPHRLDRCARVVVVLFKSAFSTEQLLCLISMGAY